MTWTKPEFEEVTLSMEVTAYVNTDGEVLPTPDAAAEPGEVGTTVTLAVLDGTRA